MEYIIEYLLPISIVAVVILLILIFSMGYITAPTDTAFIISGLRKKPKVLIGKAGIKIPFLERKDFLTLKQISVDIKTNGYIPTNDFIGVDIDAVAKVRVLTKDDITVDKNGNAINGVKAEEGKRITEEMVNAAMKNFLNMREDSIRMALTDSLQGNMREIIGTQTLKDLCNNRKGFGDEVQAKAQKDMNALGIWIESCNIQKIEDERGLITALGQDNMSKIQKDASIAKAKADAEVATEQAKAKQLANDAEVAAQTDIAMKQNQLAIKQAELKKESDVKKAEADAAYSIQEQEQRKSIEEASVNADIARREREVDLKRREAEVMEQTLEAEIKRKAEAERYEREQIAQAELFERQKKAEAEKFEAEQAAQAKKAEAEAEKFARLQEAEGISALGRAEAEAIQAKGLAEAEAINKKAEAMQKYGKAAMVEMIVNALPEMAKAVAEPFASIDNISIIDSGNGDGGVNSMGNYVPGALAKTLQAVKEVTGLDLVEVMKAETYDAKVNRNINITGLGDMVDSDGLAKKVAGEVAEQVIIGSQKDEI